MKIRVVFWACVCVLVVALASCAKKNKNAIENAELVVELDLEGAQENVPEPDRFVSAIVLSPSTQLYLQGRDENMHSIFSLKNNDIIEILLAKDSVQPETNIKDETYLHAVYDSVDFWIPQSDIALSSDSAVVIFDSTLYEDAQLLSPKTDGLTKLRFGTVIARNLQAEAQEQALMEAEAQPQASENIFYYDTSKKMVKSGFIKPGNTSAKEDDIEVLKIVEQLKVTTKAVARNNLFARAEKYNPSPRVKAALEDQMVEKLSYNYDEVVKNLQKQLYGVHVNELLTVDQSKDPFGN
ncbi:MAG: hypothetical protein J5527_09480 [Treponema sp.]|nr:hypothetical protein [Treponema sp.]